VQFGGQDLELALSLWPQAYPYTSSMRLRSGLQLLLHTILLTATMTVTTSSLAEAQASAPLAASATAPGSTPTGQSSTPTPTPATSTAETLLTPAQEQEILGKLGSVLKFVSDDTHLAIKRPVKGVFVSREGVAKELRKRFDEDEGTKRLERSELVMKKFGMLDRDFQLRPFLLSLLTEQIAGYYDDKSGTMNLLDWVPLDEQEPVMAHELTHALQDQRVHLETWGDQEVKGVAQNVIEDNAHIATDEADTARESVTEGQAMVTFADYSLREAHTKLADHPEMVEHMRDETGGTASSPVLARAPLVLSESLIFPYSAGVAFEATVEARDGVDRAFAGTLDAPPSTSWEIMNPQAYLRHVPVPLLHMPDLHPALKAAGFAPYDVGVMGALDVRMLVELFSGEPAAEALTPAWAGGIYLAAQKTAATAATKDSTSSLGLIYASRWKDAASAQRFFDLYDKHLPRKYSRLVRRPAAETSADERVYSTEEGDVLLSIDNDDVVASEGFDLATARHMRDAIEAAQGSGPLREAVNRQLLPQPSSDLGKRVGDWMNSFGLMRCALRPVSLAGGR
jgi:hypothetical protein